MNVVEAAQSDAHVASTAEIRCVEPEASQGMLLAVQAPLDAFGSNP